VTSQEKAVANIRMNRTVRDILARIDAVFAAGAARHDDNGKARTARQLWDVLSALRGPDNEHASIKYGTTAIIRAACFPKTYGDGNRDICIPATMCHDSEAYRLARSEAGTRGQHFANHARRAFDVLGLAWSEVNPPSKISSAAARLPKPGKTTKRKSKSGKTGIRLASLNYAGQKKSARR
jgi:hypothetical protein